MRLPWACALALAATILLAGTGAAEEWWCDDGSPPPNDFRLQETAPPSWPSTFRWLRSIDDGREIEAEWDETDVDLLDLMWATGGVARGMSAAIIADDRAK